jgi:PAS domain S-box-containing protein
MGNEFNYELLFNLSADLLCIAGYDGYFKKINPAVSKVLGYTMEELYSRPINDFVYGPDKEITARVRKELTKSTPLLNFENRYLTKSGEIVWLSWTSMPVENEQLIFAIAKDITHKKNLEEERNLLLVDLARANESLRRLNYTTSHDLRSPVNNILLLTGMIDPEKFNEEKTKNVLGTLKMAAEKLKKSLDNLVDAMTEQHSALNKVENLSLRAPLEKALNSISGLIQASGAKLKIEIPESVFVLCNAAYMESVFLNLLTNSIKYAYPGKPIEISVSYREEKGVKQVVFSDNGLGFDMEKVKGQIFGLQKTFHDNTEDSKGIGLYLVYHHVTSMGGEISVESKVNEGTTFVISFC